MEFDLIVKNGTVVTVNPDFKIIENGFVAVRKGKIAAIESMTAANLLPRCRSSIDAAGGIIMPGLVNTHTHVPMTLFRGLADDLPLTTWLNEHIFPAEAACITNENVRWGTLLACAEMLLSGTTVFCDGYFLEDVVAETVADVGMRAVLGQGVIDFPAPGVPNPADNVRAAAAYVEKWAGRSPLISSSIFCHSPYTCSEKTLKSAKTVAASNQALFQIHVAETAAEAEMIQPAAPVSPIQYLESLGILDADTLLVHAVWVNDRDVDIIANSGARVSHNAESNMKLASGIAPVHTFRKRGIVTGLGTDGCASNNDQDLFREMDMVAKLHKVSTLDPTVMDAAAVLRMATADGARALGLGDVTGSLETGKTADLIVVDTRQPHLSPLYHPASQLVYAARGSDVRHVIVAGKPLVENRKLLTIDAAHVMKKVKALSRKIGASNS